MSEPSDGNEVSIGNAYCVVYKLVSSEWIVTGQGWAQVHLYRDQMDGTHRIVGWTVLDFEVVINCNVTSTCKYKKKSDDFHKFTDDENVTYGFGFYKKEESVNESKRFMAAVLEAIKRPIHKAGNIYATMPSPSTSSTSTRAPIIHQSPGTPSQSRFPPRNSISKMGAPPATARNWSSASPSPSASPSSSYHTSPTYNSPPASPTNNINTNSSIRSPQPSEHTATTPPPLRDIPSPSRAMPARVAALTSRFERVASNVETTPSTPPAVPVKPNYNSLPTRTTSSPLISTSSESSPSPTSYAAAAARQPPPSRPPPQPHTARTNSISQNAPTRPVPLPPSRNSITSTMNNGYTPRTSFVPNGSSSTSPTSPSSSYPHQPSVSKSTSSHERKDSIGDPTQHHATNKTMDDIYQNNMIPLGKLKILPAKPTKHSYGDAAVTDPNSVIHTQHVKYDIKTRSYKGLPKEWEQYLNQQFGLPPDKLETLKLPEYKSRIPTILVQMKDYLVANGGLEVEGIFRIAPDQGESTYVKQQLNENKFETCNDISIIANLIKVWYRDLPIHILDGIAQDVIIDCDTEEKASRIISSMSEPSASYFTWLLDLCVLVSSYAHVNKMSAQNLAIVIGPNLFTPSVVDPMSSLLFSQKVATFMHKAVEFRRKQTANT